MYKFKSSLIVTNHVDSIEENVELLKQLQVSNSIETAIGVNSGKKYLSRCAKNTCNEAPELIFLNFTHLLRDGIPFIEHFSSLQFPNADRVRMVVITNESNEEDAHTFRVFGNFEFISFPIKPEDLIEVLTSVLES